MLNGNDKCDLVVNGTAFKASVGDTLIDAALGGRIVVPHDCCSGQCETCRVTVVSGDVADYGTREKNTVLACLATLEGDAEIAFDPVPHVRNTRGSVESIERLNDTLLQVKIRTRKPVPWLPGQYIKARFRGFPARDYSPTFPLDLEANNDVLVFHIKVYPGSRVSSQFRGKIDVGHAVTIRGPFGNAYLRRQDEPLVLVSTGTGFAPIWSIAVSASMGQSWRKIRVIAGARTKKDLYMKEAITWLRERGASVTLTASDGDGTDILRERPSGLLEKISSQDVVYAAGSPSQVEAVRTLALQADATFYADPFYVAEPRLALRDWAAAALGRPLTAAPASTGA